MLKRFSLQSFQNALLTVLAMPQVLAFVPALCLAAFWLGGDTALVVVALGLPLLFSAAQRLQPGAGLGSATHMRPRGLLPRDAFYAEMEYLHSTSRATGEDSACIVVSLDDFDDVEELHGTAAADYVAGRFCDRILAVIRSEDIATRLSRNTFLIGLRPSRHLDLESCIQTSGRIQSTVEEPIPLDNASLYLSCSAGFCLHSAVADEAPDSWIEAARAALAEAQRNGPSTIRAYSEATRRRSVVHINFRKELETALETGQIRPWFQPQVSTDTGDITGFEALARWEHPSKGVVGPQVFLPFAEQAKLMDKLGETIRHHAFRAMRDWDCAGAVIPRIGINFSSDELRDPSLVDRVRWELDQFDLSPDRLAVEILETVFSRRPDDVITRNVTQLSKLGCCIDLDDFGTGHASFSSIKRFDVSRIKIDRSFVSNADRDPSQQKMVSAILMMAERLNLETLAEGVETPGEHALMAQLGCHHVQGFGIGKPMPVEHTLDWIKDRRAKLEGAPRIGRELGRKS
ncbi:putative bifunctional diguanylate cyclase/phosphodiesterase [Ruegeria arenilitoris]|uniref:putative bifunctional diguanylate cyclase/phosphodiesterase n=1 Tax=Ruegeria arenilitoris TaxID=1173585 RepID=UPI0020C45CB6|nr:GGDEF domain-containing phosphodiesterase [Ruegeria arenilitoris]